MEANKPKSKWIIIIVALIVIAVAGLVGWRMLSKNDTTPSTLSDSAGSSQKAPKLIWQQTMIGWEATQTPPSCAQQPMLTAPTDLTQATSVLYPGQTRGGNYKPHGGLRFDNSTDNQVTVTAPIDGYLVRGASYIADGENEVQYTFDAMNNCGILYRVGHLRELPANLQKIADEWPAPTASSATQTINPPVFVKQGEVLATKVGILASKNTFFDWGVYDYRQQNQASQASAYQAAHSEDKELSWHAVCWLNDWLPAADTAVLSSLPAGDPTSGKRSDYCQ